MFDKSIFLNKLIAGNFCVFYFDMKHFDLLLFLALHFFFVFTKNDDDVYRALTFIIVFPFVVGKVLLT